MSEEETEILLVRLIMNDDIQGKINATLGYFENEDVLEDKCQIQDLASLNEWVNAFNSNGI